MKSQIIPWMLSRFCCCSKKRKNAAYCWLIPFSGFPQQRKLTWSSAQNSSGLHWCRHRVRFNEVAEKVPKVPEKVWEALVQRQVRFNMVPEIQRRFQEAWLQSKVRFNRVPEQVPEKVPEKVRSRSTGIRKRSGRLWCRASTGFRRRFPRRCGRLWCKARSRSNRVPEKVPEKVWEALMQSQVRFNRVPKKVPEKVLGGCGAEPGQVQQGSEEGSGEGVGVFGAEPGQVQQGLGEGSRGGLGGFGAEPGQVQQGSGEGLGGFGAARSGSTEFQRFLERSCVQSQVRFNRALEKVPENVPGSLGAKPSQVPRVPEKVAEKVRRRFLGIFGAGPGQVHRFNMVSSAWLRSTLQEDL